MPNIVSLLTRLIKAFGFAGSGLVHAVRTEMNLRIHLLALVTILTVAYFLHFTSSEVIVVLLCSALVIGLELMNSSIETLANRITEARDPMIRRAKDMAAAAVLVAALFSLTVGIILIARHI